MTDYQFAQYQVHASDLQGLCKRHLPGLQACQAELSHGVSGLQMKGGTATRLYAWSSLNALSDLHRMAVQALDQANDFSAHALARDAIALAVNAMYVLDDPGGDRLAAALRHHLDGQRGRFAAWQAAAPGQPAPGKHLAQLAAQCRQSPWYADAPAWADLGTRAGAIGLGDWVHPVLAGSADVEHNAAQDLMNLLSCERGEPAKRQAAHAYRTAKAASDAMYSETVALLLLAHALQRMASVLQDKVAGVFAESGIERMNAFLAEHYAMAEAHQNDDNLYIRVQ